MSALLNPRPTATATSRSRSVSLSRRTWAWVDRRSGDSLRTCRIRVAVTEGESIGSPAATLRIAATIRSEEHTSELQSLMRISYAVFCLKKKNKDNRQKRIPIVSTDDKYDS